MAFALPAAPFPARGAEPGALAFVGVHVVTMASEEVLRDQTVVVERGRIAAIGPRDEVAVPAGARRIEGLNGYLLPGLADLHAHATDPLVLPLFLAHGVTRVQLLNALPEMLEWPAEAVKEGLPAPAVHACAGPVGGLQDEAAARRAVEEAAAHGFRCLKPYDDIARPAYRALIAAARERGAKTVGHIPRNLHWRDMLAASSDAVAHAEEFLYSPIESQEDVDEIVRGMRDRRIALVTTLTNYDLIARQVVDLDGLLADPELALVPAVDRRFWGPGRNRYEKGFALAEVPNLRRLLAFQRRLVKRLQDAGATLLLGTDTGNSFVFPGASAHAELRELVAAGLTPYQALRAATWEPARFLGLAAESGSIAVGKRADLLLV
ncbi:MAG: amidohydrolase family protein, partial [Thermoanaerobaculia bacterium]